LTLDPRPSTILTSSKRVADEFDDNYPIDTQQV
jgi:hypothetical protein